MVELKHPVKLAIADSFLDQFGRLPKNIQSKVTSFLNRFKQNPTSSGINYETIKDCKDNRMRSVRIDLEYRAIILKPETGNLYPLLWVGKHDLAYFGQKEFVKSIRYLEPYKLLIQKKYKIQQKDSPHKNRNNPGDLTISKTKI